jgi:hypothetical protein
MSLPSPIIAVLAHFQPLFTAPTWRNVVLLLVGTSTSPWTSNRNGVTASGGTPEQRSLQHLPSGPQPCTLVGLGREPTTLARLDEYLWRRRDDRQRE